MTIKALLFDLGGVIVDLDFSRFFKEVIEVSPLQSPQSSLLLEFWRQSEIYHQGKITNEDFYNQACELLQVCALNKEEFFKSFNSVISHINNDVLDLIKSIKETKKYKLILLSNVNKSHWNYLVNNLIKEKSTLDFVGLFDDLLLSFQLYLTKPHHEIYQIAIRRAGCRPDEIVFVDDGLKNIRSAEELGIHGIRYTKLNELKVELKKLGIIFE
ncbi:hypothetical protein LCGC14_0290980 [marine sediment metagenome]|uniref:FCP1 homology domain-containing protein n=1 Tax=marine sediment metagenome TaxID=412755 RepID=A0A0F9TYC4_9ZZZZ|nr:HAD family phosphatase [archaeon]